MSPKRILKNMAKKGGVSIRQVKRDMQYALDYAYLSEQDEITRAYQNRISHKGTVPTVDEFLKYASSNTKYLCPHI